MSFAFLQFQGSFVVAQYRRKPIHFGIFFAVYSLGYMRMVIGLPFPVFLKINVWVGYRAPQATTLRTQKQWLADLYLCRIQINGDGVRRRKIMTISCDDTSPLTVIGSGASVVVL